MEEKKDVIFVDGMKPYPPHENAPDFIVSNILIFRDALIEWLKQQPEERFKVDLKITKNKQNWYLQKNTYKKENNWEGRTQAQEAIQRNQVDQGEDLGFEPDIPF